MKPKHDTITDLHAPLRLKTLIPLLPLIGIEMSQNWYVSGTSCLLN